MSPSSLYQIIKNHQGTAPWAVSSRYIKDEQDYESDAKKLIKKNYPKWIKNDYEGFYDMNIFNNISEEKFNKLWFEQKVRESRSREMLRKFIKRSRSKKVDKKKSPPKKIITNVDDSDDSDDEEPKKSIFSNSIIKYRGKKSPPKKIITNVDDSDDSDDEEPKKSSNKKKSPPKKVKKRVTFAYQPDPIKFYDPNSDGTNPRNRRSN